MGFTDRKYGTLILRLSDIIAIHLFDSLPKALNPTDALNGTVDRINRAITQGKVQAH